MKRNLLIILVCSFIMAALLMLGGCHKEMPHYNPPLKRWGGPGNDVPDTLHTIYK